MCPERVRNENGFSSFVFYSCFRCFILHVSSFLCPDPLRSQRRGCNAWALLLMQLLGLWAPIYGRRSVVICIVCSQGLFADDNQDLTCARPLVACQRHQKEGFPARSLAFFHTCTRTYRSDRPSVSTTVKHGIRTYVTAEDESLPQIQQYALLHLVSSAGPGV